MVIFPDNIVTPTTIKLRSNVLKGLTIAITFAALTVSIVNYLNGNILFFLLDFLLFLFCSYIFIEHARGRVRNWQKVAITYLYIFAISIVSMAGGLLSGLPFWLLTFPILLYLLFGRLHGLIGSGALLAIELSILYVNTSITNQTTVVSILVNLVLSYAVIWTVSHVYEVNREKSERALLKLAQRDPLTQTCNRLALTNYFKYHTKAHPIALALIDIDNFKAINDNFGHDVGDNVLIQLSKVLKSVTGENNIFRIGGEEFVLLLTDTQYLTSANIIDSVRRSVEEESFNLVAHDIYVTVSIGVAKTEEKTTLTKLLKTADERLYKAKANGKNCIVDIT